MECPYTKRRGKGWGYLFGFGDGGEHVVLTEAQLVVLHGFEGAHGDHAHAFALPHGERLLVGIRDRALPFNLCTATA